MGQRIKIKITKFWRRKKTTKAAVMNPEPEKTKLIDKIKSILKR